MEFSQAGSDELLTLWTSNVFTTKLLFYTFKKHPPPPTTTWDTSLHQQAAPCCHHHFCVSTGSTNGVFSTTGDLNTYKLLTARARNSQLPPGKKLAGQQEQAAPGQVFQ